MADSFDWNAIVDTSKDRPEAEELKQIASDLYDQLIYNIAKFTDWEYQFITHMADEETDHSSLTTKQSDNLYRLRDKYLS